LDDWRIAYIFYRHFNNGFGAKSIEQMLQLDPDDSFFTSSVAKTFLAGWSACDHLWMSIK
jgi:hypothetical protein